MSVLVPSPLSPVARTVRLRATGLRPVGLVFAQFLTVTALAYLAVTMLL